MGELAGREAIPDPGQPDHLKRQRMQLQVGNRDLYGFDFRWIDEDQIAQRELPRGAFFVERREYGPLLGMPVAIKRGEEMLAAGTAAAERALPELIERAQRDRRAVEAIEKDEIGDINYRIEQVRLRERRLDLQARRSRAATSRRSAAELERNVAEQQALYDEQAAELQAAREGRRHPRHLQDRGRRRRRSCARSTSTAPTRPTGSAGSAGSRCTPAGSGSS